MRDKAIFKPDTAFSLAHWATIKETSNNALTTTKTTMNARAFFDLVCKMRAAQKTYYNTSKEEYRAKADALVRSKQLEKEVDKEIERVASVLANRAQQLVLDFNNDNGNGAAQSN